MDNQTQNPNHQASPPPAQAAAPASVQTNHTAAALAYLLGLITGLYFYLTSKDKFVRFHAMQSIIFSIVAAIVSYLVGMFLFTLYFLIPLINLAFLALWLFLMYKAYKGEKFKLPVIGDFAEKEA